MWLQSKPLSPFNGGGGHRKRIIIYVYVLFETEGAN